MPRQPQESIHTFPARGINVVAPRSAQPVSTCVNCLNVVPFDQLEGRMRGGSRPGLSKYNSNQVDGSNRIQEINYSTVVANAAPVANALQIRETRMMAISNGTIAWVGSSGAINTASTAGNATLSNTSPFMMSSEAFGRIYITDGLDYKIWVGSNNAAIDWSPTAGSLPGSPGTIAPRLIATWRGRIVLSGLRTDPHNWFMSRLGDPLDFDYTPSTVSELQAVQGGVGVVGKAPDKINCLLPYSQDILLLGCDHSIWQLSGDPQISGRMDLVDNTTGMAFGRPYCQDPAGNIYFFSSRGNIYRMNTGGAAPESLSEQSIEPLIVDTDLNATFVRMTWDDSKNGMYVFLTPFVTGATTHYFWDARTGGWFPLKFASNDYNPMALKTFDGDSPNDRVTLLGGEDGYIRYLNDGTATDDGTAFVSHVTLGPIIGANTGHREHVFSELQLISDLNTTPIKYEVLSDDTAEGALNKQTASFAVSDSFGAGMSVTVNPRTRGFNSYIKLGTNSATARWSMEYARARIQVIGSSRGRRNMLS